ncbi:FAD-linked oxidoreductase DDB_G0289697 [Nematostella vectensis]|uniref:FAD-linked oxidoreductase DDB_G0289697 n=1 Tax=Nematostella vectensis TaxID=45351 RepID=UPI0013901CCE|nr:FAD-linked oxidoreductase DDB_G0289697 [Nematostella vectensis]
MADFSILSSEIKGKVVLPEDSGYSHEIKKVWNAVLLSKRPLAFVKVKCTEDVVKTVKFCTGNQLDLCVSSGATGDLAIDDDAVVIDFSHMKGVTVDRNNKVATVLPGSRQNDVDSELYKHGFAIPLGSYSQLGVAGLTLIGGIGFLASSYGCTSDNLLKLEVVTVDGEVLSVSEDENEELFWGMKGFGANFGIVTSLVFQLHEMPQWIVGGCLYYSISNAHEVFRSVRDFHVTQADDRLSIYMILRLRTTGPEIIVRVLFNGPLKDGGRLVQDLADATHPYKNDVGPVRHDQFQAGGDWMFSPGKYYYGSAGHFVKELSDEVIDNVIEAMLKKIPGPSKEFADTIIYMNTYGGKMDQGKPEHSSFPFRNTRFWVGVLGAVSTIELFKDLQTWVDGVQEVNTAHGLPPFGDYAEQANRRLKALKKKYDPENVLCRNLVPILLE